MADEGQAPDDLTFTHQELDEKATEAIEAVLASKIYDEKEVSRWINEICERIIKSLYDTRKPFKYMVTCLIMQKTEAGLLSSGACMFEGGTDMMQQFLWPKEKAKDQANKTMHAVVTIFCARF
ncbi:hypothetical protein SteCoe_22213 [Stentor coeruleus]|uniref:Dynein light chain n=1 Tax=Stentor coeruleus TaxID=5963 RepID=A0A1R2BMP4_9CILI|nr:hypothetical protein SteCoe_22213 [Stentor coeruleus]